jgi:hypothetical protein
MPIHSLLMLTASLQGGPPASLRVTGCEPVPGLAQLMAERNPRFLILGEAHGTSEIPKFFGDVVCNVSQSGPVVVALEWSEREQTAVERYLKSAGELADRAALLKSSIWSRQFADGRSSRAMLQLLERLRQLRAMGRQLTVVPVQPTGPFDRVSQDYYEVAFANGLVRAALSVRSSVVIALLGNWHAAKESENPDAFRPMAEHLPTADVVSVQFRAAGGSAWNCQSDGCGPHTVTKLTSSGRAITMTPSDRAFDAFFSLGGPVSASEPAN